VIKGLKMSNRIAAMTDTCKVLDNVINELAMIHDSTQIVIASESDQAKFKFALAKAESNLQTMRNLLATQTFGFLESQF
jgi:hypothetical protein